MYYIGEISKGNRHEMLIELWDGVTYISFAQARKKIKEIEEVIGHSDLQVIDERDYDIPWSQKWGKES
jgi:hypothetical protein